MEKNLQSSAAIKKLQLLVQDVNTCMFISSGKSAKHSTRPMAVVDIDAQGNLWFFTSKDSNKVKDIENDQQVQLVFASPAKSIFIDVHGRASVETDRNYIEEKWTPLVKAWFPEGKDDPSLCLIKVKADEAHYWSVEGSKVGAMVKIALSAVSGKKLEEGVHGQLHF
jgi:general stress protein 26